jgi:glyceraldehyde 3-phosphate dehydrogenase
MKKVTAGINGFGRFGLHLLKYWLDRSDIAPLEITYINDENLSIHDALTIIATDRYVVFDAYKVSLLGDTLKFLGPNKISRTIKYTNRKKSAIPWAGKPDIVLECSGKNTSMNDCAGYLFNKTKIVIISATSWDAQQTLVFGFNHKKYRKTSSVISYGSCTVNAYIPLAHYLNKKYGVSESDANFVHNIQEYRLKDFNTLHRKFCTLEKSGPDLLPFLNQHNFTINYTIVPYTGASMLDFRFKLRRSITKSNFIDDLHSTFVKGELKNLYHLNEIDSGPEEHNCTTHSAVFIKENIRVLKNNVYLHGYFDTENSVNRYFDLIQYIVSRW